jgi:16S rRNA (adenine1518-N6/adenine1519-N6)-dimethyltransferase
VLTFTPLAEPRTDVGDEKFFRQVVKAAFGQRRKTLWNCLKSIDLESSDSVLVQALADCGIEPARRGETLSLDEFALLAKTLVCLKRGHAEVLKGKGVEG